jgi:hypothetical protein
MLVGHTKAPAERAEREGTAWENVLSQIGPDGEVSFETALAAFSIVIGPLPGVSTLGALELRRRRPVRHRACRAVAAYC